MSPPSPPAILSVERLSKSFEDLKAVDGVSFEVAPGEIVGLLGPNGAGKTTTISMILGVLEPTAGRIEIGGVDLRQDRSAALRSARRSTPPISIRPAVGSRTPRIMLIVVVLPAPFGPTSPTISPGAT